MINRAIIIVLDSFGVGELPDSNVYGDCGSNTLMHIYKNTNLNIPNLKKLGLYNIENIGIEEKEENPIGAYGKAREKAKGKNSPVGHWEIAGYVQEKAFKTYPKAFPEELIQEFIQKANLEGIISNEVGSGTELLKKYGAEHIKTGKPIIYTSADSVFQIAAHEDVIPVEKLYEICEIAREILNKPEYNIGTVIARPFIGDNPDNFKRTYNRKDFEYKEFGKTLLDIMSENQKQVIAIGKIQDLFSGRGITKSIHTKGNEDGIKNTIEEIKQDTSGLIFTNLVDYDMLYGHRRDIQGYANALEEFDKSIPEIMQNMKQSDILIITADHGCDPSFKGTDHTREHIPIIVYGSELKQNVNLGIRETYADIAATLLDIFDLPKLKYGKSFKKDIVK